MLRIRQKLGNARRTVCRKDAVIKPPGRDSRCVRRALSSFWPKGDLKTPQIALSP